MHQLALRDIKVGGNNRLATMVGNLWFWLNITRSRFSLATVILCWSAS